jgi:CheY-like chemotaxis protein
MKTVLIVDDEELFLASLAEGLSEYSNEFAVVTSPEGEKATAILKSRPIDLVVTDLKMPVMDGLQLIAYMMRNHPPIPVIVMTAFGTADIEGRVGEFDILGYMEKPIDYQLLAEKIRSGLSEPARGQIEGITLFSFLQLLQMEQKTCSLKIQSGENEGFLHFSAGELFNAATGKIEGEEAAYKILSWDDTKIEIISAARKMKNRIHTSLNNLLMKAAQMEDEKSLPPRPDAYASLGAGAQAIRIPGKPLSVEDSEQHEIEQILDRSIFDIHEGKNLTKAAFESETDPGDVRTKLDVTEMLSKIASEIAGFIAASVVDLESGMTLAVRTTRSDFDLAASSSYDSGIVRHEIEAMKALNLKSTLDDIVLTLSDQIHLIKIVPPRSLICLAADRSLTNVAIVRNTVAKHVTSLL